MISGECKPKPGHRECEDEDGKLRAEPCECHPTCKTCLDSNAEDNCLECFVKKGYVLKTPLSAKKT